MFSACALLVPPSWRQGADVPLAGPIDPPVQVPEPGERSAEEEQEIAAMRAQLERDRARVLEIMSAEELPALVEIGEESELRELADRIPRLQRELRARGERRDGTRIRHPVIR
jgi:hypothetical protein